MKKVIIIYPNSFPYGGAATNRVIHIAKGLIENGIDTEVLITRGTEKKLNKINLATFGNFEGIPFQYTVKNTEWPNNSFCQFINLLKGFANTVFIISKLKKRDEIIVISAADYGYIIHLLYFIFFRLKKIYFIYTVDEYPWQIVHPVKYSTITSYIYLLSFYKFFDGIICISPTLLDYYAKRVRKNCKLHIMEMTVEPDKFVYSKFKATDEYIAYCGYDISYIKGNIYSKDGVEFLIRAFHRCVVSKNINLKLYIIGDQSAYLQSVVSNLNLGHEVIFIGSVSSSDIPRYLCGAKILALTRPANIQASGGVPTKLGEYLATGNPVIISKVGDIQKYLIDKFNAFLVEPGNIDEIADVIMNIISDYDSAIEVGRNGQRLATNVFSYKVQGIKLKEYLVKFYVQQ